jgi:ATP-binding cassette subfamily F protein uup
MHYVTVENLSKSYGIKPLFSGLTFHISEGDKIALIARNGTGKTTMLRILAGVDHEDSGKVWVNKDVDIALFEQEPSFDERETILRNIFFHKHPVMDAIREYEASMETEDHVRQGDAIMKWTS